MDDARVRHTKLILAALIIAVVALVFGLSTIGQP